LASHQRGRPLAAAEFVTGLLVFAQRLRCGGVGCSGAAWICRAWPAGRPAARSGPCRLQLLRASEPEAEGPADREVLRDRLAQPGAHAAPPAGRRRASVRSAGTSISGDASNLVTRAAGHRPFARAVSWCPAPGPCGRSADPGGRYAGEYPERGPASTEPHLDSCDWRGYVRQYAESAIPCDLSSDRLLRDADRQQVDCHRRQNQPRRRVRRGCGSWPASIADLPAR
jgi:hypothetical protein